MMKAAHIHRFAYDKIHSEEFKNLFRKQASYFTRKRELSFGEVFWLILQKMSRSLAIETNQLGLLMKKRPVSKQAFSAARYKIAAEGFQQLHEDVLRLHFENNPLRKWKSYRVFGGDGTTLSLPKRGDISDYFGDHFKRTCLARVLQYTELTSDIVLAASLKPYSHSEKAMGRTLLPELVNKMRSFGERRQLYVYDRGFPSHAFAQQHENLGVKFLFRVQKRYGNEILRLVSEHKETSFIQEISRGPIFYKARVVIRYLSSGEPLVLMTNLIDSEFSDDDLVELYQMRWRCEESYKFQKTVLQMDATNCRTYEGVNQEFWATVLLATMMTFMFNEEEDKDKESGTLSTKINRSVVFGSLKALHLRAILGLESLDDFYKTFRRFCQRHRVPIRPNRSFPRLSVETRKTRHCYRRVM